MLRQGVSRRAVSRLIIVKAQACIVQLFQLRLVGGTRIGLSSGGGGQLLTSVRGAAVSVILARASRLLRVIRGRKFIKSLVLRWPYLNNGLDKLLAVFY